MKKLKYLAVVLAMVLVTAGPVLALNPIEDVDAAEVEMTDSNDVAAAPPNNGGPDCTETNGEGEEGECGEAEIVVNPSAQCTYTGEITDFLTCLEDDFNDTLPYQMQRYEDGGVHFAINRNDGADLPDIRIRETDPVLQTVRLSLKQASPMEALIGGFEEDPSVTGGNVYLWLNGIPAAQVNTAGFIHRKQVTQSIFLQLQSAGYSVAMEPGIPEDNIAIWAEPGGKDITAIKLQIQDPAIVTTDLSFNPKRVDLPLGGGR